MEKAKKLVVWQNYDVDPEDHAEFFDECYPEADEDTRWRLAFDLNWDYLDDERNNLYVPLPGRIVVIGSIGRWNGRFSGYQMKKAKNLSACLEFMEDCEYAEWYVENGEFQARQSHHDGTNLVTYRLLPDALDDEKREKLEDGDFTLDDLLAWTESLAPYVCDVYGWKEDAAKEAEAAA